MCLRGCKGGRRFDLLVTGGSQGARVMSDVVPPAIELTCPGASRAACMWCNRRGARISNACAINIRVWA